MRVLFTLYFFVIVGNALTCQVCKYDSSQPKEQQKCSGSTVEICLSTTFCYSASYTQSNGVKVFETGCDKRKYCPNAAATCQKEKQLFNLKSCAGTCCTTDNCNNPNSGTGNCLIVIL